MMTQDRENFYKSWVKRAQSDDKAALRMKQYTDRPEEELYDVETDPFEMNNLAGDPQYRPIMDDLKKRLEAWMAQQDDKGMETEMTAFSRQPKKG